VGDCDLKGKHGRVRSVPIANWVKAAVEHWIAAAGITSGRIFRPIDKAGQIRGDSISDQAIYNTLVEYALLLGLKLAPHDMRRTFAQLARKSHAGIEQIQMTLGHASIQTTERYLGTSQDLQDAPSDRVKLRIH
jgi:integrase/recombinase XerD